MATHLPLPGTIGLEKLWGPTVEEMNEEVGEQELRRQLDLLEQGVLDLKHASMQALGFVRTIDYQGIAFNVSRRFVIADLSPLAFFHLIEPIAQDEDIQRGSSVEAAVLALHDRLLPLLSCTHDWTALKREDDERVLEIMSPDGLRTGLRPRVCKSCTAYALGQALPVVGRMTR